MNATILLDNQMVKMADNFSAEHNIISLDYFKVNKNLYIPSTIIATLANYLNAEDENKKPDKDPVLQKIMSVGS
jgi:anaerobic C4-dicarboxylate transporter